MERIRNIFWLFFLVVFRGANGFLIVFSVIDRESFERITTFVYYFFEEVRFWMSEIKNNAPENAQVILVGNKCDFVDQRVSNFTILFFLFVDYHITFFE